MKRALDIARPLLPAGVKRRVKRALPARLHRLVDPNWHRTAVGGLWDEIGKLQFEFLVGQGLRPDHYFLDIGCGSLRGGVHFIRYLEPGHYYGFDRNGENLEAGRTVELPRYGLVDKQPVLEVIDDFDVSRLNQSFDFALAQSVFTHISLEAIDLCLRNVEPALASGGRFYATYNERSDDLPDYVDCSHLPYDRGPTVRYDFAELEELSRNRGLSARSIGDWGHPRGQKMVVFTKAKPSRADIASLPE